MDVWCNWFSISACHAEGSASHCGFESRHVRKHKCVYDGELVYPRHELHE